MPVAHAAHPVAQPSETVAGLNDTILYWFLQASDGAISWRRWRKKMLSLRWGYGEYSRLNALVK